MEASLATIVENLRTVQVRVLILVEWGSGNHPIFIDRGFSDRLLLLVVLVTC